MMKQCTSTGFDFEFICNLLKSSIHGIPPENSEDKDIGYPFYRAAAVLLSMKYWKRKHRNYFIRVHHEQIDLLIDNVFDMLMTEEDCDDDRSALMIIVEML